METHLPWTERGSSGPLSGILCPIARPIHQAVLAMQLESGRATPTSISPAVVSMMTLPLVLGYRVSGSGSRNHAMIGITHLSHVTENQP